MNKDELERGAEEYAEEHKEVDWEGFDKNKEELKQAYLAGAEPREKRIAELEAQIEKMKCCYNCSKWNEGLLLCNDSTVRVTTYADYCCEDWEIKEK